MPSPTVLSPNYGAPGQQVALVQDGGPGLPCTLVPVSTPIPAGGVETIRMPLGLVTSSSTTMIPAGSIVLRAYVEIVTPYSPGASIELGQSGSPSAFQGVADNDAQAAAVYEVPQVTSALALSFLLATIGGAPAVGAGFAIVEYVPNPNR